MDYKKAYEEALKRAKQGLPIDEVFPELKDSENEMIRKQLINEVREQIENIPAPDCCDPDDLRRLAVPQSWLAYLERQKEQKPVQDKEEREYVRTLKSLIVDFLRDKECVNRGYYQDIYDWLDGRHIEQQPKQEWSEEDIKKIRSEEYTKGFNDAAFGGKLKEWSEEDENALEYIHELIGFGFTEKFFDAQTADDMRDWLNTRLKSLRPQPHWKPSEEQMEALKASYLYWRGASNVVPLVNALESLYNDLKKL